ncbi:MAG TPA: histidine phosphatase family protein [Thiohalobacter sp.]|nr:histidine phosphatase family protein [Thiohalobacter sp.]
MTNTLFCHATKMCAAALLVPLWAPAAHADDDLWAALRQGGKVVLMRHAPVERGPDAGSPSTRDPSCRDERNLSGQGRQDAQAVGRRFAEYRIPIADVLHSPYCRAAQTAQSAFNLGAPEKHLALLDVLEPAAAARQTQALNRIIGSHSGQGNLVLITHEPNISAVSFELLRHLDMLVIQPKGGADFEELGVIRFSDQQYAY